MIRSISIVLFLGIGACCVDRAPGTRPADMSAQATSTNASGIWRSRKIRSSGTGTWLKSGDTSLLPTRVTTSERSPWGMGKPPESWIRTRPSVRELG